MINYGYIQRFLGTLFFIENIVAFISTISISLSAACLGKVFKVHFEDAGCQVSVVSPFLYLYHSCLPSTNQRPRKV